MTSADLCAHLTWKNQNLHFLLWFLKRSSVHVTATLSNLNGFQIIPLIFALPKSEKFTKHDIHLHFLIYYLKKVLLITSLL